MAKNEKKAAAKSSDAKASAGQEAPATNTTWLYLVGAVAAVALIGGVVYWRASSAGGTPGEKTDPDLAALMAPGPLPDLSLGKEDAANTIVEYASMTCPHCAEFHKTVLPELQAKYFDNGQARLILREFPLDGLAVAAFMLARCAGPDRYYPMVGALFDTQETWARPRRRRQGEAAARRQAGRLHQGKIRPVHRRQGALQQDRRDPHPRP